VNKQLGNMCYNYSKFIYWRKQSYLCRHFGPASAQCRRKLSPIFFTFDAILINIF